MIERQSKWHGQPPLAHFDNDLRYWHLRVFTTFFSLNGGLYLKHVSPWWPLKFLGHWLNRPRKVPQLSLEMVLCQLPTSRSSDKVFGLSEVCIYLYFWLVWLLLQNSLDLHNCNLALKFLNFQIENLYLLLASNSSTWCIFYYQFRPTGNCPTGLKLRIFVKNCTAIMDAFKQF